jgi:hypothetical protein
LGVGFLHRGDPKLEVPGFACAAATTALIIYVLMQPNPVSALAAAMRYQESVNDPLEKAHREPVSQARGPCFYAFLPRQGEPVAHQNLANVARCRPT